MAVDFIGRLDEWEERSPVELRLDRAAYVRGGEITEDVLRTDGRSAGLDPGERIRLEFEASAVPHGMVADYYLRITGHYDPPE